MQKFVNGIWHGNAYLIPKWKSKNNLDSKLTRKELNEKWKKKFAPKMLWVSSMNYTESNVRKQCI